MVAPACTSGYGATLQGEIVDEPIPDDCHAERDADYDGAGLVWGISHKKASAAQCCQACKFLRADEAGRYCNVWVWCGE